MPAAAADGDTKNDVTGTQTPAASGQPPSTAPHGAMQPSAAANAGAGVAGQPESTTSAPDAGATMLSMGRNALGQTPLPCDLRGVLQISCQGCHARSPGLQAPMALTSREDLLGPAISDPSRKVFELMRERTHDSAKPMPPSSSRRLTDGELATLDRGLIADLPLGPAPCDDANGGVGRDESNESITYPAPDPSEIEQCYPLLAHDAADKMTPYRVPSGESHGCFIFDIPWGDNVQAISFRSKQSAVVHHWLLSDQHDDYSDGTVIGDRRDCNFGAQKIYGVSAINQQSELNMPPGVGLVMPSRSSGVRMMVSMHYYNPGDPYDDASGTEICIARTPRPQTASIAELGVDFIALAPHRNTDLMSTCKPSYANGEIHVLRAFPHMHARGVRLDTIIQHEDGTREPLIDVPFDFNNQIAYDMTKVLRPGDTMVTTCHYVNETDRTVFGGESTDEEMCINFITAWPQGSLATGRDLAGAEACY